MGSDDFVDWATDEYNFDSYIDDDFSQSTIRQNIIDLAKPHNERRGNQTIFVDGAWARARTERGLDNGILNKILNDSRYETLAKGKLIDLGSIGEDIGGYNDLTQELKNAYTGAKAKLGIELRRTAETFSTSDFLSTFDDVSNDTLLTSSRGGKVRTIEGFRQEYKLSPEVAAEINSRRSLGLQ